MIRSLHWQTIGFHQQKWKNVNGNFSATGTGNSCETRSSIRFLGPKKLVECWWLKNPTASIHQPEITRTPTVYPLDPNDILILDAKMHHFCHRDAILCMSKSLVGRFQHQPAGHAPHPHRWAQRIPQHTSSYVTASGSTLLWKRPENMRLSISCKFESKVRVGVLRCPESKFWDGWHDDHGQQ